MAKWAPDNEKGLHAYVVTTTSWSSYSRILYASSLIEAKKRYGWTRGKGMSVSVRRATSEDMKATNIAWPTTRKTSE